MPLGAFIADKKMMDQLADQPVLGHITTFGGHPVCCAAGKEALQVLIDEKLVEQVEEKSAVFIKLLVHPKIKSVRSFGLWLAVEFEDAAQCKKVIDHCIEAGLVTDWFLFAANCLRISPPLVITKEQATSACSEILKAIK
jgi:acetylornithine/succinyldiaminopimelate/putrescine aminotransferase